MAVVKSIGLTVGKIALGVALSVGGATGAWAAPLIFTFTGNGNTYVTTIDSNPIPTRFSPDGYVGISTIGTLNGLPYKPPADTIFFNPNFGYGHAFTLDDSFENLFVTDRPLYSGAESNPTFSPGIFNGTAYDGSAPGQLKIAAAGGGGPGAPAPEVGGGLLAGLAAFAAFAATRMRGSKALRAA